MANYYIGVDISKKWIDVFDPEKGAKRYDMEEKPLKNFVKSLPKNALVILEATGGYENPLLTQLCKADISYHRANPARSRYYAHAQGIIGKTDRVDARCLAHMGATFKLRATVPLSATQSALKKLATRRRQLVDMRKQEKMRSHQADDRDIQKSIAKLIDYLSKQINMIEKKMAKMLADEDMKAKADILQTMPGIDPITASTLLAELSELGDVDRRAIAALAGLAPIAKDSGVKFGRKPKLTEHQQNLARQRLLEGESARSIAKDFGVSHTTITRLDYIS